MNSYESYIHREELAAKLIDAGMSEDEACKVATKIVEGKDKGE